MFPVLPHPEVFALVAALVLLGPLLVAVGGFFTSDRWRLPGKGLVLVPIEFRLSGDGESKELIYFRGRPGGFMGRLLAAFGLHHETVLSVTEDQLKIARGGISGFQTHYAPLSHIASSACTYHRTILFLVLSFAICLYGLVSFLEAINTSEDYSRQAELRSLSPILIWCSLAACIFYVMYKFSKRVVLSVETFGGRFLGICYKRGFTQGFPVELTQAVEAVRLLNIAIRRKEAEKTPVRTATAGN